MVQLASLNKSRAGFSDARIDYISSVGAPGGDASYQDAAPRGSYCSDSLNGDSYKKVLAGAGQANWQKQASLKDLAGLTANQSWREPVITIDNTSADIPAAIAALALSSVINGATVTVGDRVLFNNFGATPTGSNVYILGGAVGAFTLTEDTNLETAGDTVSVLGGNLSGQIWLYNGTTWGFIGANSSSEDTFVRAYIGKNAAGAELPAFTSNNYVLNGDNLATSIGKLDAQAAVNMALSNTNAQAVTGLQTLSDAMNVSLGLTAAGAFVPLTATTYSNGATSVISTITQLDAAMAARAASVDATIAAINTGNTSTQTSNTAAFAAIDAAVGLSNGNYIAPTTSTYLNASTSVMNALGALDVATNANVVSLTALDARVVVLEANDVTNTALLNTHGGLITALRTDLTTETNARIADVALVNTRVDTTNTNVSALTAQVNGVVLKGKVAGVTAGVIDSINAKANSGVSWLVRVQDPVTFDASFLNIPAFHNGNLNVDAAGFNWTTENELAVGAPIAGLDFQVALVGAGVNQSLQLSVLSTGSVDIEFARMTS